MTDINAELARHWSMLRGRTYDLLGVLSQPDLQKKLPFERSQSIAYQFWCMLGSQESWVAFLRGGAMQGWACSLRGIPAAEYTPALLRERFEDADRAYLAALAAVEPLAPYANGLTPLVVHNMLVEHEAHHHGQLINFIYAHELPIPESWAQQWALSRD